MVIFQIFSELNFEKIQKIRIKSEKKQQKLELIIFGEIYRQRTLKKKRRDPADQIPANVAIFKETEVIKSDKK